MDINKSSVFNLLEGIIGISLDVISNEFNEFAGNTNHKIVFQIKWHCLRFLRLGPKVLTEKVVCIAGSGSTRQCIESLKWQKTVSSDWAFWSGYFKISNC